MNGISKKYFLTIVINLTLIFISVNAIGQITNKKSIGKLVSNTINVSDSIKKGKYPLIIVDSEPLNSGKRAQDTHNSHSGVSGKLNALRFYPLPIALDSRMSKKIRLNACTIGIDKSNEFGARLNLEKITRLNCHVNDNYTHFLMGEYRGNGDPITRLNCKVKRGSRYLVSFEVQSETPTLEGTYKISYLFNMETSEITYSGTGLKILNLFLEVPPNAPLISTCFISLRSENITYQVKSVTIEELDN